jgi:hypothetical protein
MKTWIWRIVLPFANALLLFALSPQSLHGAFASSAGLYFLVSSLELVPRDLVNLMGTYQINHHWLHSTAGYWASCVFWEYVLMVSLFWWWIGWMIDRKIARRSSGLIATWVGFVLAVGFSLMLFFEPRAERVNVPSLMSIVWGLVLVCYSLLQLFRGIAMLRSTRATT